LINNAVLVNDMQRVDVLIGWRARRSIDAPSVLNGSVFLRYRIQRAAAIFLTIVLTIVSCSGAIAASGDAVQEADIGFQPERDGFSFENYGSAGHVEMSENELLRLFGEAVCIRTDDGRCLLTPPGIVWMNSLNTSGHCQGLSTLSLLMFAGVKNASDFGGEEPNDLLLEDNDALQREISFWHFMQRLDPGGSYIDESPIDILRMLSESLNKDNTTGWYVLGIEKLNGSDAHALTPFAIESKGSGHYSILVYDSNFPNQTMRVDVDAISNTWSYDDSLPDEPSEIYEGNETSKTLTLLPIAPQLEKQVCPFCEGNRSNMTQIWWDGEGMVLITDSTGRHLGYLDGKLVSEIPGGRIVWPISYDASDGDYPSLYIPQLNEDFAIDISGPKARSSFVNLTMTSPGYTMTLIGVQLNPGRQDLIEVLPNDLFGGAIIYHPAGGSTPVISIGIEKNNTGYLFRLKGSDIEEGAALQIDLYNKTAEFVVWPLNTKSAFAFDLLAGRQSSEGERYFVGEGIAVKPNESLVLDLIDWPASGKNLSAEVWSGENVVRSEGMRGVSSRDLDEQA
jgi:hypothetical protein